MVISRPKAVINFLVFIGPALLFYYLFFINPFVQGFLISLTNWDGVTPKAPISLPADEFETKILNKLSDQGDKEFFLTLYKKDSKQNTYNRLELTGWDRIRVLGVLNAIGYEPDKYRFVGLDNYKDIITGNVNPAFYPREGTVRYFQENSFLPDTLESKVVNLYRQGAAGNPQDLGLIDKYYQKKNEQFYSLKPEYYEFLFQNTIRELKPGSGAEIEAYLKDVAKAGLEGRQGDVAGLRTVLTQYDSLSAAGKNSLDEAAANLYEIGVFKKILASHAQEKKYQLGVLGFTFLFTVLTVVLANLFALMIALALDKKIRSKNVLRSVFFLPNIISLVIVAFIWSLIFGQLLPRITGIQIWMGNPDIAPFLVILVAVWQGLGYYMVIYLAGLQSIPQEILEVAAVDGASSWKRLVNITLPLLMPAFTICLFLSLANALKSFDIVFALVGPSGYSVNSVPVVMDIFYDAFARKMAGLATAKAILLMIVIITITGIQLSVMKRKEVEY